LGIVFDPYMRKVESAVFHDIEAGYEFGVGLSLRAAITTSPTRIRHLSRTNRTRLPEYLRRRAQQPQHSIGFALRPMFWAAAFLREILG
jgi:hypothetical protein